MARKKSSGRADQTFVSGKSGKGSTSKKSRPSKPLPEKKPKNIKTEYEPATGSTAVALISAVLFILFLVICINPEGKLLEFTKSLVLGLIGQVGFYFSIPAFAYMFFLHVFARNKAPQMRSVCTLLFVFTCGCIFHLIIQPQDLSGNISAVTELYQGGSAGTTGGVLCGGIASLLRWACGTPISYLLLGILAVLSLLGSMQITIPSIFRAVANRPRPEWYEEEDEQNEFVEPAAVVVNHIANKRIEQQRQKRQKAAEQIAVQEQAEESRPQPKTPTKKPPQEIPGQQKLPEELPPETHTQETTGTPSRAAAMMNTIGLDIHAPIGGAAVRHKETEKKPAASAIPVTVIADDFDEPIPSHMPPLEPVSSAFAPQKEMIGTKADVPEKKAAADKPVSAAKTASAEKQGKVTAKDKEASARQVAEEIASSQADEQASYCFPPIDLLKSPMHGSADGTEEMRENSRRLNETLASFRIDAHITNVTRGPTVTRYEIELDRGVRLSKVTGCADDIALSLGASGVRIAAVPGKISIVGIEVPNRSVTTVSLREVIDSPEFAKAKSKSSFAVGKDIGGSNIIGNISKMPHMLIAGTTGSGKSVCMNSIIISLLYKASPEDVKLIMVDPKMVELGIYNGIPHLLIPVVTDPKKAAGSLQWAVTEMLRRYKLMSDLGVRDLESYNSIVVQEENGQKLPQVVVIIDELADLMLVAAKEVEDSICRIAQMGRASGMHLIIATQRPSADVITGLMKANIPSRIAFSVASAMESRIILDTQGAEKLVGKGDMLYAPIGSGKPLRVQGCFVTDGEVEAVAGYVKNNYVADYNQQVLEEIEKKAQQTGKAKSGAMEEAPTDEELDGDEMLPAAVDVILETGQASVSMLQRRLKLGYARAARIVDEMEEKGIVGPFQGSKPRSILITKEQWATMRGGNSEMEFDDYDDSVDIT